MEREDGTPVDMFYGPDMAYMMAYITSVPIPLARTKWWLHLTAKWARIINTQAYLRDIMSLVADQCNKASYMNLLVSLCI